MNELKEAYLQICKAADIMSSAQSRFSFALSDSKYEPISHNLPDDVVDVVDYGNGSMTYEKFIETMDDALEEVKDE